MGAIRNNLKNSENISSTVHGILADIYTNRHPVAYIGYVLLSQDHIPYPCKVGEGICADSQRVRGQWAVYYTSPQNF